ncbi:NOP58, partial [Hepatospora eriocheir]
MFIKETNKYYLLEAPMGLAIFNNNRLFSMRKYSSVDNAFKNITGIKNLNFSDEIRLFFVEYKKAVKDYDFLIVNDKDLKEYLEREINIRAEVDISAIKKIKNEFFSVFTPSLSLYNQYVVLLSKKLYSNNELINLSNIYETLDTTINTRCMRIREWYAMHFPELSSFISSNNEFLNFLIKINKIDGGDSLTDNQKINELILNTVGSKEFTNDDINKIVNDAREILSTIEYKSRIKNLLNKKTKEILPNTYDLLEDSNLIIKFLKKTNGSLNELSLMPSSTLQILGAEKSYNKNISNKDNKPPKHGFIYSTSYVQNCNNKGRISRMLANKISICLKIDVSILFDG